MPDAHDEVTDRRGASVLPLLAGAAAGGALLSAAASVGTTVHLFRGAVDVPLEDWVVFLASALDGTALLVLLVAALLLWWSLPRPEPLLRALGLVGFVGLVLNAAALLLMLASESMPDPFGGPTRGAWSDVAVLLGASPPLVLAALLMWVGSPPRRRAEPA